MRFRDRLTTAVLALAAPSIVAMCSLVPRPTVAQQPVAKGGSNAPVIRYVKRGAPVRRVSAGVRGHSPVALDRQAVVLIAPHDHVGWTMDPQPVLFWRYAGRRDAISSATLVLRSGGKADSVALPLPDSGLQRIELVAHKVTLARDVDYQWTVVVRRGSGSQPPETDDAWLRVVGSNTLATEPGDPMELASAAAAVGLWYDAFTALTDLYVAERANQGVSDAWSNFVSRTVQGLTPPALGTLGAKP